MKKTFFLIVICLSLFSCSETSPEDLIDNTPITELITFDSNIAPIIQSQCLPCHDSNTSSGGVVYETYFQFREGTENGNVIDRITRNVSDPFIMPQGGQLPESRINLILQWEIDGYLEN